MRPLSPQKTLLFALLSILSWTYADARPLNYHVVQELPHDAHSFTQGLEVVGQSIIESSGRYNQSFIFIYHEDSGLTSKQVALPSNIFAEGLTVVDDLVYLLSWKAQRLYILDQANFSIRRTIGYRGEGWGLTHTGEHFIMSNGSNQLSLRDTHTFKKIGTLHVHDNNGQWSNINELEYAHGLVWANVWQRDLLLAIDPSTGWVRGTVNLQALSQQARQVKGSDVLNGIAYSAKHDAFWVTGKLWPKRYLIKIDLSTLSTKPSSQLQPSTEPPNPSLPTTP